MSNPGVDEALREQAAAWLARVRGGGADDQRAFKEWYQADPSHAAAYDAVLDSWEISEWVGATPLAQARANLARTNRRRRYLVGALAATVAAILLAFGAYSAGLVGRDPKAPVEFASRTGEIRTLVLDDSSRVTLDSASLVKVAYSRDERRVFLSRGRARFRVAHDQLRPFIVATPAGLVIAHGTVFDVALDRGRATVALLEGSIEVRSPPLAGRRPSSRMLSPGQRVVLQGGDVPPPTHSSKADVDWPHAMLSFENAPLGEVVAAANRFGLARIVLSDPALARLRFTGTFKVADGEQLASLLATAFDLELARSDDRTFVLSPSQPGGSASK
jgi:transmembrane sensor